MNFRSFSLNETLVNNIESMGYTEATSIQEQVMPLAMDGKDISGLSRTGTGKTAAFLIPTINRLTQLPSDRLALCLSPTRELALQIQSEGDRLSKDLGFSSVCVVGGMSSEDQINHLKNGARLITGTPGRIIDLFKEKALDLSKVDVLIFDEADRMFDMGFVKDMHYILSKVNPKRQILLFSATMNFSVMNMIYEYGADPQEINVSRDQMTADKIQQVLFHVGDNEKPASLLALIKKFSKETGTIIVFVNYKERVPWVAAFLTKNGIPAQGLSSLLRQEKRNKIIAGFKSGQFRALVATDVASRGLDVDDISLVVNYHLPEEAASYVHRIGRTARAGRDGIAVAICSSEDAYNQMRIEEFLGNKIPVEWLTDEEVPKNILFPRREDEVRDDEDEIEGSAESQGPRGRRNDRGGPQRGPRGREEGRGPRREPREHRPAAAPIATGTKSAPIPVDQLPAPVSMDAGAEADDSRAPAPRREHSRGPREDRAPREHRGPREHREPRDSRGDRPEGRGRNRFSGRRDRDGGRVRPDREVERIDPATLPNPLTGNPIIYDMKTGKPKNRTESEFKAFVSQYKEKTEEKSARKKKPAPAIIKKISSKVTALFGSKSK